jgi:peptide/nickel transport system permease protein
MLQYLIRRILWAVVLFLAVTLVTYVIFFIIPVNPAKLVAGRHASNDDIKRAEHFLGTDRPVYIQYEKFLLRLTKPTVYHLGPVPVIGPQADLGRSFATRQSVSNIVATAAPVTASLVFGAVIIWMMIALPVGILSALKPRSLLDRTAMTFVLVGISLHPVWIGLVLAYFFAFKLGLFPITGYCDMINPATSCGGPIQWAYHLVLPWTVIAILNAALYVRMIRANVLETVSEDFVRTARAKGAPEHRVLIRHVLRNAMLPVVTMLGMDIGIALGGAIFTENVFGLPGLGQTALDSIQQYDLPITQGVVVFTTCAIIFFNLLVDLLYAWIDPRIRLG